MTVPVRPEKPSWFQSFLNGRGIAADATHVARPPKIRLPENTIRATEQHNLGGRDMTGRLPVQRDDLLDFSSAERLLNSEETPGTPEGLLGAALDATGIGGAARGVAAGVRGAVERNPVAVAMAPLALIGVKGAAAKRAEKGLAERLMEHTDGFTFDPRSGQFVTSGGVMVGGVPGQRGLAVDNLTPEAVRQFIADNHELLSRDGMMMGGWRDSKSGKFFIDVSERVPPADAPELLKARGEKAGWDLDAGAEVVNPHATDAVSAGSAPEPTPTVAVGAPSGPPPTPPKGPRGFGINDHVPEQESLLYHLGPETDPQELMNAYNLSREAFDASGPASHYLDIGRGFKSAAPWYDTRSIFQRAANVLGDEKGAEEANALLGGFMPAVTARSAPNNNLLRAFLWRRLARDGVANPENLLTHHFEMPTGFGHLAQGAHQSGLERLLRTGEVDPIRNPKPASFGHNLTGNAKPGTFDTVMGRILRAIEPSSERFFSGEAPKMWAYEPLERGLADASEDALSKGLFDLPDSRLSPTGSYQSLLWHGATPSAKQGSMSQIHEGMVAKAAKQWGVTEAEADRLIWAEGAVPGLPLDAAPVKRVFPFDR